MSPGEALDSGEFPPICRQCCERVPPDLECDAVKLLKAILLPYRLLFRLGSVALLGTAAVVAVFLMSDSGGYSEAETKAIHDACSRTVVRFEDGVDGAAHFGVIRFLRDPGNIVRRELDTRISQKPGWTVEQKSVFRALLTDLSKAIAGTADFAPVLEAARRARVDVIVAGRVIAVEPIGEGAEATLGIYAYDLRSGRWLLRDRVTGAWQPGFFDKIAELPWWARLLIWSVFTLALPWGTAFLTHAVLARKSNFAGLCLLAGYIAADMLLAFVLTGFEVVGTWSALRFIMAFLLCTGYNYWACERIADRAR